MKKLSVYILSFLCGLCMVFGLIFSLNVTVASAETATGTTPTFSVTKYKISKSQEHMLLATGIKDYEDVYEVGYAFKDMEGITKYHAVTTKYYTSITSGNSTWTASEMFGGEYTGMIVWEIAYDKWDDYTYQAYAKVGDRVDGNLVTTDTIVYGTRKDILAPVYTVSFMDGKTLVDMRKVASGESYGELPEAPIKERATFKGWYLNAEGAGEALTSETFMSTKANHIVYAVYEDNSKYNFSDESQLSALGKYSNINYTIENGYLKVTKSGDGEHSLFFPADLKANSSVEIDVEYVGENVAYASGNQITFLGYTANAAGDADGKTTAVMGNASWDGGWNCQKTTVTVGVTQACAGVKMQFVFNSEANAYFKITGIRIVEYPLIYDFEDDAQLNSFTHLKNASYSIAQDGVDKYLKVTGNAGEENTVFFKSALKTGAKVEIDVEYIATNVAYSSSNQITFLGDTANASGSADGKTTAVMGNAKWDGAWDCKKTTVAINVTQDCAGIRMQFVFNSEANAYFKINGIRVFYPDYPTYMVTTYANGEMTTFDVTYGSAYGALPAAADKAGYTFKGWYLNADGTGAQVTASSVVSTAENHTLYAFYEKEAVAEKDRTEYDFTTEDQINDFGNAKKVTYEIVDDYLKVVGTQGSESILVLNKELTAGQVVEIDVEYVATNVTYSSGNQITFLAYTANASGDADGKTSAVMGNANWDGGWNCKKTTVVLEVTQDCAGVRMQFVMNSEASAYFKITAIRIVAPIEYPFVYDFTTNDQLNDFVELDHGGKEIVTDETGVYAKFTPTDMNNLYSIFWLKQNLKAGMVVEMDFELVGNIVTKHGIWTWGANASGGTLFDGQFVTGWDAKELWNGGKFTSTTNITQDCYGVRIQMKYGDNSDAYWKLTSVRIYEGNAPTYTVKYNADGVVSTANVTLGKAYGTLPTASEKDNAEFIGWYLNADGTGKQITENTLVTTAKNHTIYAVYKQYYTNPNFFEAEELWNIVNYDNTKLTQVRDASGNYIKLAPMELGDYQGHVNYPQSQFLFQFPMLKAGMFVEMDFELVGDIVTKHGVWTWGTNANGEDLFDGRFVTAWDAPDIWNGGKFTAVTEITEDCAAIKVLVRYANNPNAYWKLTGIRVYSMEEYCDIPTYADDKQIDIGGTSWLGTNQTLSYFNGTAGEENFKKLQEAGITMLAGTFYGNTGSETDDIRLLDLAKKYGIGLFFQKNWDGSTIPSYVAHEAFLGYYIDEPAKASLADLKTLQTKWNNSAFGVNGKLLYVNLLPIYSGDAGSDYEAYVQEAIDTNGLPIVSFDHYLMYYNETENWLGQHTGYESTLSYRTDWLKNFDIASYYADQNDVPLWYTLMTTQHTADGGAILYKDSTVADLTYQMYVAMTYGATNLVHYTFAGTGDYIIDGAIFNQNTGEFTQTYTDVKEASTIIGEWDHVFMNFDWKGVSTIKGTAAQTGLITDDLNYSIDVSKFNVMQSVTSTQDVIVGHFEDANGYEGVMVTNLTLPENATEANVSISFNDGYYAAKVYQNGEETLVYLKNGQLSLNIASGEGVFIIPIKAK